MKIIGFIVLSVMLSQFSMAAELTQDALQGSWLITDFQGNPSEDTDYWEFEGNQFYQKLGGRRMSPDAFTVKPGVIDLGYAKVKVLAFEGDTMTADMAGFKYVLKKE